MFITHCKKKKKKEIFDFPNSKPILGHNPLCFPLYVGLWPSKLYLFIYDLDFIFL